MWLCTEVSSLGTLFPLCSFFFSSCFLLFSVPSGKLLLTLKSPVQMFSPAWSHSSSSSSCCQAEYIPPFTADWTNILFWNSLCICLFPILTRDQQTTARGPHLAHCLLLDSLWNKNGVYIFKWLGKNQKEYSISWHIKMIWDSVRCRPWLLSCYNGRIELLGQRPCVACKAHDIHCPALYKNLLPLCGQDPDVMVTYLTCIVTISWALYSALARHDLI